MIESLFQRLESARADGGGIALQGTPLSYFSSLVPKIVAHGHAPLLVVAPEPVDAERLLSDIRFFSPSPERVLLYPGWEILPFENLSPHPDISATRLNTLYAALSGEVDVIVAPAAALMQRTLPKKSFLSMIDYLAQGEEAPFEEFLKSLVAKGYGRTAQVEERGEFSVRGGIVDLYPPSADRPVRIEFFGDEIESMRSFDLETQRSHGECLKELVILPAKEAWIPEGSALKAAKRLKDRGRDLNIPKERLDELFHGIKEGISFPGMEFFFPDFFEGTSSFFDYLPEETIPLIWQKEEVAAKAAELETLGRESHGKAVLHGWPFPAPEHLYLEPGTFTGALTEKRFLSAGGVNMGEEEPLNFSVERNHDIRPALLGKEKGASPLAPLVKQISAWRGEGWRVCFSAHTLGQGERLAELLTPYGLSLEIEPDRTGIQNREKDLKVFLGELSAGFRDPLERFILITEEEIFGERQKHRTTAKIAADLRFASFSELKGGDYIVHIDHGIGLYKGLNKLKAGGTEGDYLELEYFGGDKVFLPVDRLNLVQRYAGGEKDNPVLDKLGAASWEKLKKKAKKAAADIAEELLKIYAAREALEGFAFSKGGKEFHEFEAAFEYEETDDQKRAIDDVLSDMESRRPMDRLVCGDVGYGKTEVAIRAAFKAVMDGRQVAILVPTTILAQQHHKTFTDRFKGYPVMIEKLTRFCGHTRHKEVLDRTKEGKADIIIGTHRLLQKDVAFKNLGLVVIDEEQRFGVSHKEKLKKMRKTVDVLTLTATPIPRTLNMAMSGIRDMSIINSPPEGRQAIKTAIIKFDEEVIREAVLRELRRGGQVFLVHNRVQEIQNVAARVRTIVPEAKVAIAHGQMNEEALEKVMLSFYEGESNLLICTTIVESGLDIPAANTIIINDAQKMGLAQLYQLRGRVGRSKHRAYAYMVVPGNALLTKDAGKRLQAIQEMTALSSGFRLASYDLEIRGAGNIIGAEQSGQIEAVGFEMFTSLLEKAVSELKGKDLAEEIEPEVKFPCPAYIPEDYVADTNNRLMLYKRFSSISEEEELIEMLIELKDRFGPVPEIARNFIELISLKILLRKGRVKEAAITKNAITFVFHEQANIDINRMIALVGKSPRKYAVTPDMRLKIISSSNDLPKQLEESKKVLKELVQV